MQTTTITARRKGTPNLPLRLLEVVWLMQRANVGFADALDLLASQLRTFEEYEQHREAADHLPFPIWMYGQGPA